MRGIYTVERKGGTAVCIGYTPPASPLRSALEGEG